MNPYSKRPFIVTAADLVRRDLQMSEDEYVSDCSESPLVPAEQKYDTHLVHRPMKSYKVKGNRVVCMIPGCDKSFANMSGIRRHWDRRHRRMAAWYNCTVVNCTAKTTRREDLIFHMSARHNMKRPEAIVATGGKGVKTSDINKEYMSPGNYGSPWLFLSKGGRPATCKQPVLASSAGKSQPKASPARVKSKIVPPTCTVTKPVPTCPVTLPVTSPKFVVPTVAATKPKEKMTEEEDGWIRMKKIREERRMLMEEEEEVMKEMERKKGGEFRKMYEEEKRKAECLKRENDGLKKENERLAEEMKQKDATIEKLKKKFLKLVEDL
jgi:hypothetical protein